MVLEWGESERAYFGFHQNHGLICWQIDPPTIGDWTKLDNAVILAALGTRTRHVGTINLLVAGL